MKPMKPKNKLRVRLVILYVLSFIVSVAPLLVVLIVNWGEYTNTVSDAVKLSCAGVMIAVFLFLKVVGKLKMPRRVVFYGLLCLLVWLLQPVMGDLLLLSGMAFLGELIDFIFFQSAIKRTREKIHIEKQTESTAGVVEDQMEAMFKKYMGSGRV